MRRLQADGGEEAVLFEEWQDAASLYAWVGPNLTEPRLIPGVRELVEEVHVTHYESLSDEASPSDEAVVAEATSGFDGAGGPRGPAPGSGPPAKAEAS